MEDFTAQDKTELSVKLGDRITVMAKDPSGMHTLVVMAKDRSGMHALVLMAKDPSGCNIGYCKINQEL